MPLLAEIFRGAVAAINIPLLTERFLFLLQGDVHRIAELTGRHVKFL